MLRPPALADVEPLGVAPPVSPDLVVERDEAPPLPTPDDALGVPASESAPHPLTIITTPATASVFLATDPFMAPGRCNHRTTRAFAGHRARSRVVFTAQRSSTCATAERRY